MGLEQTMALRLLEDLTFKKEKVQDWADALMAAVEIHTNGDENISNAVGLRYLQVQSFKDGKIKGAYKSYLRGLASQSEATFRGALQFIVQRFQQDNGVRAAKLLSRLMTFKFAKMNRDELDAFNRIIEEYEELTGQGVEDSIYCTSIARG